MLKGNSLRGALISIAVLWVVVFIIFIANALLRAENTMYDLLYQNGSRVDTRIVIVGIDEESISRFGQWPWPRSFVADVIDTLSEGGAAAIGIDLEYDTVSRFDNDDDYLAQAISKAGNVVLPVRGLFRSKSILAENNSIRADEFIEPIDELVSTGLGHVNGLPDQDGVVRRAFLNIEDSNTIYHSLSYTVYDTARNTLGLPEIYDNIPIDRAGRYYINYTGGAGYYHPLSFADVHNGNVPSSYFKDKIVLIGLYAHGIARDWYFTSIDKNQATYGVEIHANMIQQLLDGSFIRDMNPILGTLLFLLFTLGSIPPFLLFKPRIGLVMLLALLVAHGGLIFFYVQSGIVAKMTYMPLFCVLAFVAALIWHYVQTHANEVRIRGTFGRYMAPAVLKKVLDEGEDSLKLEGQRRQVTVLFVDIRNFTPMSEVVAPEEVVQILNDYLDLVSTCIHRHGGTLDKFIGDAAMALWNAPYDVENHALAAVSAAIDMQRESAPLEKLLAEKYGRAVQFGVGINTGDAIIGNIGAEFRMDYTAIGDTVNIAARLESNAKPGQILASKAVVDCLDEEGRGEVMASYIGEYKVKGKSEEISVYEVNSE